MADPGENSDGDIFVRDHPGVCGGSADCRIQCRKRVCITLTYIQPVLSSQPRENSHWLLRTGSCLPEDNYIMLQYSENVEAGCLIQADWLIEVTSNRGLTACPIYIYIILLSAGKLFVSCVLHNNMVYILPSGWYHTPRGIYASDSPVSISTWHTCFW